jgi:hypothetical protein
MAFISAQSNIANDTGAILFYTNGCWIANANNDTMLNGWGLNPDPYATQWCTPTSALPYPQANIILPMPVDSTKYVLFHHGGSQADPNSYPLVAYYSLIDITLDNGTGGQTTRTTGYNTVLPKWWQKCFYETFVQNSTAVILLDFSAINPPLRQYLNRFC